MKKIGIICEYNPFHNGHLYHIEKVKEMYPDSIVILVLGGYFLERGDISLISKWNKTKIALKYGVDLVIELPTLYNTNSADIFARTSVQLLSTFQVDAIVFGSETADVDYLKKLAQAQKEASFSTSIKENLKKGLNYPSSLSKSLNEVVAPNDILGVAYIKAIEELSLNIAPVAIKRTNDFDDLESEETIVSAGNIRKRLREGENIDKFIPTYGGSYINKIDEEKLFELVRYKIITDDHLERYLGVDEGIENRLKRIILKVDSYNSLIENLKTKRYTTARIKRLLLHILLGIEKTDIALVVPTPRILGFNQNGQKFLRSYESLYRTDNQNDVVSNIEKKAALIYYDLTGDESIQREFLNCPIIKES